MRGEDSLGKEKRSDDSRIKSAHLTCCTIRVMVQPWDVKLDAGFRYYKLSCTAQVCETCHTVLPNFDITKGKQEYYDSKEAQQAFEGIISVNITQSLFPPQDKRKLSVYTTRHSLLYKHVPIQSILTHCSCISDDILLTFNVIYNLMESQG